MTRLFLTLLLLALWPILSATAQSLTPSEIGYFMDAPDLPLPPGFVENRDEAVIFDTPGGRILEMQAQSSGPSRNPVHIVDFYAQTLPSLGWTPSASGRFFREGERLILTLIPTGATLRLLIRIEPKS